LSDKPNILVVDDDEDLLLIIQHYLKPSHYNILLAKDAETAFKLIDEKKPDVVLVDLVMPGMGGIAVCSRIKTTAAWKHIKVAIITGNDTPQSRQLAKSVGAEEYLVKDMDPFELIKSMEILLGRM
jgi:CheY-like chemotaxis protein